jgi:hypothetical protein
MVVLGIVLIVLAVLLGLGVSVSSSDSTTMSVFGVDFGVAVPTVFFLGTAVGVVLVAGLWLTKKGLGRGYRRHKEVRELRQQVAASPATETAVDNSSEDTGPDDGVARTVDIDEGDRLAGEHHIVADSTEPREPHR